MTAVRRNIDSVLLVVLSERGFLVPSSSIRYRSMLCRCRVGMALRQHESKDTQKPIGLDALGLKASSTAWSALFTIPTTAIPQQHKTLFCLAPTDDEICLLRSVLGSMRFSGRYCRHGQKLCTHLDSCVRIKRKPPKKHNSTNGGP